MCGSELQRHAHSVLAAVLYHVAQFLPRGRQPVPASSHAKSVTAVVFGTLYADPKS